MTPVPITAPTYSALPCSAVSRPPGPAPAWSVPAWSARRFRDTLGTTPLQWLLEQRVRLAQELLESTDEPIERIARRTGFGNAANLRQHFYRLAGVASQTYRQVFRSRPAVPEPARPPLPAAG